MFGQRPQSKQVPRTRPGFSIVEMVLVVAIIGTLASIAVPRFSEVLARQRIDAAAQRIVQDLNFAWNRAYVESKTRTARFSLTNQNYTLHGVTGLDRPDLTYKTELQAEPYGVELFSADFGGDREINYDADGVPDSGGTVVIRLGSLQRTIEVNADTGKARVQ